MDGNNTYPLDHSCEDFVEYEDVNGSSVNHSMLNESSIPFVQQIEEIVEDAKNEHAMQQPDAFRMAFQSMQVEILKQLTDTFNKRIQDFFTNDFDGKLQQIVKEIANTSENTSQLDSGGVELRLNTLEQQISPLLEVNIDKVQTFLEELKDTREELENCKIDSENRKTELAQLRLESEDVCRQRDELQQEVDRHLAEKIQQEEVEKSINGYIHKINALELKQAQYEIQLDNQEQQGRKNILDFGEIPYQGPDEDTSEVIIDFLDYYLGISIRKYDIDISHRMTIASEKKKHGNNYIPPIYVKFVNRSWAYEILKRRHMLRYERNRFGKKFYIRENLTLKRRMLKERTENELTTFRYIWVKNGNIFARKDSRSRAVKITDDAVLNKLLQESELRGNQAKSSSVHESYAKVTDRSMPTERNIQRHLPSNRTGQHLDRLNQYTSHYSSVLPNSGSVHPSFLRNQLRNRINTNSTSI